jgi:hypothetical protein
VPAHSSAKAAEEKVAARRAARTDANFMTPRL